MRRDYMIFARTLPTDSIWFYSSLLSYVIFLSYLEVDYVKMSTSLLHIVILLLKRLSLLFSVSAIAFTSLEWFYISYLSFLADYSYRDISAAYSSFFVSIS